MLLVIVGPELRQTTQAVKCILVKRKIVTLRSVGVARTVPVSDRLFLFITRTNLC